jgi:hypothetical protein
MILPNGTVLPHGLLNAQGSESSVAAFNRSYKNTGLKAGFIVRSFVWNDPENVSQLCTEYDVQTMEQDENKGSTSILYRNCMSSQGFGSIADFFEFTLRPQTYQSVNSPSFSGQDGAIVLIRCLDDIGSKAVVVGGLIHPDRPTTIPSTSPKLAFTYNGIAVNINNDGSFSLAFNGATDSKGSPTDSSQGTTTFQIKTDGSFQFNHSTINIQADKSGALSITTTGPTNIIAQGVTTIDGSTIQLGESATEAVILGNTFAEIFNNHQHIGNLGFPTSAPLMPMDPSLSKHTFTE